MIRDPNCRAKISVVDIVKRTSEKRLTDVALASTFEFYNKV
jgi:hypothetical protein